MHGSVVFVGSVGGGVLDDGGGFDAELGGALDGGVDGFGGLKLPSGLGFGNFSS